MSIEQHIYDNGGSIRTGVLKESTPNPYYGIRKAIESGEVVRIKNGVYMLADELADTMIDIEAIVPGGILCLYSAWVQYGLSTQIPDAYYVAIDDHRRVVVPEDPPVKLCYWQKKYLDLGVVRVDIMANRGTHYEQNHPLFGHEFRDDPVRNVQWNAFLRKSKIPDGPKFPEVMELIEKDLKPYWDRMA